MLRIATQRRNPTAEPEEERLLNLFQNRSELKREFAKLRREGDQLKDQLRQQEGETLRSQQQLEQLEGLLAHPVQAANASVYYQLRGVWGHCRRKLARLADDLLTHQRDREMKLELDRFNASRAAALSVIARHEHQARKQHDTTGAVLEALRRQGEQSRGIWNYFKRRAIAVQVEAAAGAHQSATAHLEECLAQKQAKESEAPPACEGLSVEGRRKINLALIAIAQELYLHFSKRNIARLAREASVRQVTDVNYGDINACRELNIHIDKYVRSLPAGHELVANVRDRIACLERSAGYRHESDTVPVAGSFAEIPLMDDEDFSSQGRRTIGINVLAEEYWELYSVLLT